MRFERPSAEGKTRHTIQAPGDELEVVGSWIEPPDLSYYGLTAEMEAMKEKTLADIEKEHIERTLLLFGGHKAKTAEALAIDRKTLRLKMRRYGLEEETQKNGA